MLLQDLQVRVILSFQSLSVFVSQLYTYEMDIRSVEFSCGSQRAVLYYADILLTSSLRQKTQILFGLGALTGVPLGFTGTRVPAASAFLCSR